MANKFIKWLTGRDDDTLNPVLRIHGFKEVKRSGTDEDDGGIFELVVTDDMANAILDLCNKNEHRRGKIPQLTLNFLSKKIFIKLKDAVFIRRVDGQLMTPDGDPLVVVEMVASTIGVEDYPPDPLPLDVKMWDTT